MNYAQPVAFMATAKVGWPGIRPCESPGRVWRETRRRQWSNCDTLLRRLIVSLMERGVAESTALAVSEIDWSDIQATLNGSSDAYARIVTRYQQTIGTQMWRFTKSPSTYEDLVHDVFVEAYLSLRQFRGKAPFIHWLRKIAVRVGYRHWKEEARRRSKESISLVEAVSPQSPDETAQSAASAQLHSALALLSPRDRLVVTLVHLEQRSLTETADLLGWTTTMVKVQAFRAATQNQENAAEAVVNSSKEDFDALIEQVRSQTAPPVDVTARVVESIRTREVVRLSDRPTLAIVMAAVTAASVALGIAWHSRQQLQNPLVEIFCPPNYVVLR